MNRNIPRVMIAGSGSGCGKTTVTCGLLSALKQKEIKVCAFKCGPDYIDPMFHSKVLETRSRNLDLYLCGEDVCRYLLAKNTEGMDVAVIEGVMGMYDGMGFTDDSYSANHISRVTGTPELLVVNVRGKSISLAAEIKGYLEFGPNQIAGVILNNCSAGMYPAYQKMLKEQLGIRTYGYMPFVPEGEVGSRHLGLITADEIRDVSERMEALGRKAMETLDLDGILELADSAEEFVCEDLSVEKVTTGPVRIGIAKDQAFCFYYEDVLDLLEELGAELVPFSPMEDPHLPKDICGLILGGGYPEVHIQKLAENRSMLEEIRLAGEQGMPVYAECGGFMYLGESITTDDNKYDMVGLIPGNSFVTDKLVRFGYKELTAERDGMLCARGEGIRCHEFHYSDTDVYGDGFTATNRRGKTWETAQHTESLYAGYPHLHLWGNPDFAGNFVRACDAFSQEKGRKE